ncbi:MAG: protein kinase [Alphaproteobacteria bacterium]|nr:protein kinase [Alphaproteobacteria bacterium]
MSAGGRYEILHALGKGGFGTVYRARFIGEEGFTKDVALKVLNADTDGVEELACRFRDEARLLGLIRHRSIVQVDRLTRLGQSWAVVMEYVEGVNLKEALRLGPAPLGPALEIVSEIAGALHAAYTATGPDGRPLELLHRDIKPSNLQLTRFGEVKLLDFGIARARFADREALTRSLTFGSMAYMAPERLDFIDGPEGDVYALGAVLYELLGEPLGQTRAAQGRHERFIRERVEALASRAALPDEIIALLQELLAWEPEQRPSAEALELRCQVLGRRFGVTMLRRWAQERIEALPAVATPPPDVEPASGTTLAQPPSASASTPLAPPEPLPPPRADATTRPPSPQPPPAAAPTAVVSAPRTPPPRPLSNATLSEGDGATQWMRRRNQQRAGGLAVGLILFGVLVGVLAWRLQPETLPDAGNRPPDRPEVVAMLPTEPTAPVGAERPPAASPAPVPMKAAIVSSPKEHARSPAATPRDEPSAASAEPVDTAPPELDPDDVEAALGGPVFKPSEPEEAFIQAPLPKEVAPVQVKVIGEFESLYAVPVDREAGLRQGRLPGPLLPGEYTLYGSFASGYSGKVGSLVVFEGEPITLKCRWALQDCSRTRM